MAQVSEQDGDAILAGDDSPPTQAPGLPIEAIRYSADLSTWEKNPRLAIIRDRFEAYDTQERLNPWIAIGARHQRGRLGGVQLFVTEGAYSEELSRSLGLARDQESGRGLPSQSVAQLLVEMSRMINDGVYVGAPVWEFDPTSEIYFPDRTVYRDPRTFHQAIYDEIGRLLGFWQQVVARIGTRPMTAFIPINQVVYAVDNAGGGPVGIGRKRSAQLLHQLWLEAMRQLKAAVRRFALGLQQITFDDKVPEWAVRKVDALAKSLFADADAFDEVMADAATKVSQIFAHVQQVVNLPLGLTLKQIGPDFDPEPLLRTAGRCAHAILQLFGAGHLYLGSEGTGGTYNLSETQAATEETALRIDVMTAVRAINVGIVDRWYDYNTHKFGVVPSSERAYLTFSGLDSAAKAARVKYLSGVFELIELAQKHGSVDDVIDIRREAGLRPLDDSTMSLMRARQTTNAALGQVSESDQRLADLRQARSQRRTRTSQESTTDAGA